MTTTAAILTKQCVKCECSKPIIQFRGNRKTETLWCRDCLDAAKGYNKKSYTKTYSTAEGRAKILDNNRAYRHSHKLEYIFWLAHTRAVARRIPFTIALDDVRDLFPADGCCPIFGYVLTLDSDKRSDTSASIDRIDPTGGYTPGNVQIISWRANQIKKHASAQDLEHLIQYRMNRAGYATIAEPDERHWVKAVTMHAAWQNSDNYNLSPGYITSLFPLADVCPALGLEFEFDSPVRGDNSPALTRIVKRLGFVQGNVEILSCRANSILGNSTVDEMKVVADYLTALGAK